MKTETEILYNLISKYQSFTKWVLRHDKDIAESQRGKDHLREIDEIEAQIKQLETQQEYTSELAMYMEQAKARNMQIMSEMANQDELLRDHIEPKQIVKNDFRTFLNSKAVFTWDKIDMIVRFVEEYSLSQQPKENKSASKLISDMAEWSRKYPRMDDELIKLEERAKEIDEYLTNKEK